MPVVTTADGTKLIQLFHLNSEFYIDTTIRFLGELEEYEPECNHQTYSADGVENQMCHTEINLRHATVKYCMQHHLCAACDFRDFENIMCGNICIIIMQICNSPIAR